MTENKTQMNKTPETESTENKTQMNQTSETETTENKTQINNETDIPVPQEKTSVSDVPLQIITAPFLEQNKEEIKNLQRTESPNLTPLPTTSAKNDKVQIRPKIAEIPVHSTSGAVPRSLPKKLTNRLPTAESFDRIKEIIEAEKITVK